jgi:hypothetical protein
VSLLHCLCLKLLVSVKWSPPGPPYLITASPFLINWHFAYAVVRDLLGLVQGPQVTVAPCECRCAFEGPGGDCSALERLLERRLSAETSVSFGGQFKLSLTFVFAFSTVAFICGLLIGYYLRWPRAEHGDGVVRGPLADHPEHPRGDTGGLPARAPKGYQKGGRGVIVTA